MGINQTISEKIIARHAGKDKVSAGEIVSAKLDVVLGNDITAPLAFEEFDKIGINKVFNRERVVLVPDHFTPAKDIKSAQQCKLLREFAKKYELKNYFEIGRVGVEHALLPEEGLVLPGDLIIGADSHTCTYGALGAFSTGVGSTDLAAAMATGEVWLKVPETIKVIFEGKLNNYVYGKDLILFLIGDIGVNGANYQALEFHGSTISDLSIYSRFTMANMAIEAGAKNGIFPFDKKTIDFLEEVFGANRNSTRSDDWRTFKEKSVQFLNIFCSILPAGRQVLDTFSSDSEAIYAKTLKYDVSNIEPQVAFPFSPQNSKPISKCGNVKIDQVLIGSCTNGWLDDLRIAAKILKGKKVHRDVRLIVIPATPRIYKQAIAEGLVDIFIDADGIVSAPTCGPCLGGHMGILAEGERCVSTTNRNFVGRMGHVKSEVYLANPAIAAATAVLGKIAHPQNIV